MPWPHNYWVGAYPKFSGGTDLSQYIMSYKFAITSSGGNDHTMAQSFTIALEGPTLTRYSGLSLLSIDSWKNLLDKFLLNFQGYRPKPNALTKLSLYRQLGKESIHDYYKRFLMLKSQLPYIKDQITIHYAINNLRISLLYNHCPRDPPSTLRV